MMYPILLITLFLACGIVNGINESHGLWCMFERNSRHTTDSNLFQPHKEWIYDTFANLYPEQQDGINPFVRRSMDCYRHGHLDRAIHLIQHSATKVWGFNNLWSPELEGYLWHIADNHLEKREYIAPQTPTVRKILHVGTEFYPSGGHTRVLISFFEFLPQLEQSVFITNSYHDVPDIIRYSSLSNLRGSVTQCSIHGLACAQQLRDFAIEFDLVILHTHNFCEDHLLAFGAGYSGPPVALFDHSDHLPWVGSTVLDVRLVYREAARRLSTRRGIANERNLKMPLPASNFMSPIRDKLDCRRVLGFSDHDTVLLTMAAPYKYGEQTDYIDMIIPALLHSKFVRLVAIGVPDVWRQRCEDKRVNMSQVTFLDSVDGATSAMYHIAADIHIDSFPFSSITSLVESTLLDSVAISFCPWDLEEDMILCAESADFGLPAFNDSYDSFPDPVLTYRTKHEFECALQMLVASRITMEAAKAHSSLMMSAHTGETWQNIMLDIFNMALTLPRRPDFNSTFNAAATEDQYKCFDDTPVLFSLSIDHIQPSGSVNTVVFELHDNGISTETQVLEFCILHYLDSSQCKILQDFVIDREQNLPVTRMRKI